MAANKKKRMMIQLRIPQRMQTLKFSEVMNPTKMTLLKNLMVSKA
jgi:hypothetical protein